MTRKIEHVMISAIQAAVAGRRDWRQDNTRVQRNTVGHATVYLHGNLIAKIRDTGQNWQVEISLAGWNTPTTRSRLSAICRAFVPGLNGVGTKRGQAELRYRDGRTLAINNNTFYNVSTDLNG